MKKRMIIMLLAMGGFVAVIGGVKFRQVQTAIAQASSFQPPPEAVTTVAAREEHWPGTLDAIGSVTAVHGVTVSADLPGVGLLGIRQANLGQYLAGGDPIVPLQSLHPIYVNFTVPQQDIGRLRVGGEVQVAAEGLPVGRITAIDSIVNEATRNVQAQATLANPDGHLRPGMFVQAQVLLGARQPVIALPASAISYAPYGDSVFIVGELQAPDGQKYRGVSQPVLAIVVNLIILIAGLQGSCRRSPGCG